MDSLLLLRGVYILNDKTVRKDDNVSTKLEQNISFAFFLSFCLVGGNNWPTQTHILCVLVFILKVPTQILTRCLKVSNKLLC